MKKATAFVSMNELYQDFEPFSGVSLFSGFSGMHYHDFYEFYLFFSGANQFHIDNHPIPLSPYTLIIIPPFHPHGLEGFQTICPYERAWLNVSTSLMQSIGMGIFDFSEFVKRCEQTGQLHLDIQPELAKELRTIITSIQDNIGDRSQITTWQNALRSARFLSKICDAVHMAESIRTSVEVGGNVQPIISYINEHFAENISIQKLSRQFGVSVSHMEREFLASTGRSVYDYVLYRRITRAREMICLEVPLTEVAYACGFNDYSCFLRAFVKLAGQTPSAYRKRIRTIGPA